MKKLFFSFLLPLIISVSISTPLLRAQEVKHTFALGTNDFFLDGKSFQIISGEMHPARIPAEYWRHRIEMARAMGCNTISLYVFWNYHESEKGIYDFHTGNHDLAKFLSIAASEGMWVIVRPGPYVCAEWEFGGIPPYLLRTQGIKVRCLDPVYMEAVERYLSRLSDVIRPYLITNGGPIIMMQVENEYGSFGNDRDYTAAIKKIWEKNDINVPFFTGDGPAVYMLEAGTLPGCAVGLDSGSSETDFDLAMKMNPGVPVFSSETYPGWLTHWGEKWAGRDTGSIVSEVKYLMDNKKSFNLYVIHGGTNFGFTAGANSGGNGYEPDVTSYDYDAPVSEQGRPTAKYMALRRLIGSYRQKGHRLPPVPDPIPAISLPEIKMTPYASVWDNLPEPKKMVQPKPFEDFGQDYGFMLWSTKLVGHKSGRLSVIDIHDYATVFLNGKYVGVLDRSKGINTIDLPASDVKDPVLEILVEGMGRINFGQALIDRKGITDRVVLNGMTLMNWDAYNLPFNDEYISGLRSSHNSFTLRSDHAENESVSSAGALNSFTDKPGLFYRGIFRLDKTGDTFIDLKQFRKGIVWVNGHNLGRYWEIGPQYRLYCPAPWLKQGENEIIIFDLLKTDNGSVQGYTTIE